MDAREFKQRFMPHHQLLYRVAYHLTGGIDVKLKKSIPVAAGLAGGSTDAAATLIAVNDLYGRGLSQSELEN